MLWPLETLGSSFHWLHEPLTTVCRVQSARRWRCEWVPNVECHPSETELGRQLPEATQTTSRSRTLPRVKGRLCRTLSNLGYLVLQGFAQNLVVLHSPHAKSTSHVVGSRIGCHANMGAWLPPQQGGSWVYKQPILDAQLAFFLPPSSRLRLPASETCLPTMQAS